MQRYPTLDTETCLGAGFLQCPSCKGVYLHQQTPTVADDSIIIPFTCENCDAVSALAVRQEKGNTHMHWIDSIRVPEWVRNVLKGQPA